MYEYENAIPIAWQHRSHCRRAMNTLHPGPGQDPVVSMPPIIINN